MGSLGFDLVGGWKRRRRRHLSICRGDSESHLVGWRLGSFGENARRDFGVWLAAGRANDNYFGDFDGCGFVDNRKTDGSGNQ